MASVRDEEEVVVGEDLADGLLIVKERIDIYFNGLYLSTSRIVFTIRDFAGTEDSLRRESDWGINWDGVRNRVF